MSGICIFDICGTLYASNTTFDFLEFYLNDNWLFRCYRIIYQTIAWKIFNKFLRITFHYDLTRILALKFLKGRMRDELLIHARQFVADILSAKEHECIISIVREEIKRSPDKVWLVSATIDVVAEAVALSLGCKHFCSTQLEYEGGVCTGRIIQDLLGRKLDLLKRAGLADHIQVFYTDDLSDADLLAVAACKGIVTHAKTKKQWTTTINLRQWTNITLFEY